MLTVNQLRERQRLAGWFLPPCADDDPGTPPIYDPTISIQDNERLAYDYFLNKLREVPDGLTILDGPMLLELSHAYILYLRCKDKIDSYELGEGGTKRANIESLMKWAQKRMERAQDALGFNASQRMRLKTNKPRDYAETKTGRKDMNGADEDLDFLDLGEVELVEIGSENGSSGD